jgi:hypothetical protein
MGYQGIRAGWQATLRTTTVGPGSVYDTLCIAGERRRRVQYPLSKHRYNPTDRRSSYTPTTQCCKQFQITILIAQYKPRDT